MRTVMLGTPGAGKGTQAQILSQNLGLPVVSTGEIFREEIRQGSSLGLQARVFLEGGKLVPDEIVIEIAKKRLGEQDCQRGFILDGFPRTAAQARALDEWLKESGLALDRVFDIRVSPEEVVRRLGDRRTCARCGAVYHLVYNPPHDVETCDQCGGKLYLRDDDRREVILKRIAVYEEQTKPLEEYYRGLGILIEIEGERSIEEIASSIASFLE
jgi:adenylate kinase